MTDQARKAVAAERAGVRARPHLLIFNPDQWRGDVLGHAGNPAAVTPFLDRLVETEAVSFTQAFCQAPVCTPSRCSFLTGWYPHTRGHRTMHHMLHPERGETHLLRRLHEEGYHVWWGGKNDLVPAQDGFDGHCDVKYAPSADDVRRHGLTPREGNHDGDCAWRGEPGSDTYYGFFKGRLERGGEAVYCDGDWQHVLGAIDFIQAYGGEAPLCIYLPLQMPHPPYCVEEPWYSMIDRGRLPPRAPRPDWTGKPCLLEALHEHLGLGDWPEERWDELRAAYYGSCARLDEQFRRVVEALRSRGIYDETAVFFLSDHGDFAGDYDLVEKTQNTFEDALTRVPFVVKPPAGAACIPGPRDAPVELVDFAATVYDLAGVEPGYDHFGRSLRGLLADPGATHRDAVFCEGGRRDGETQAMEMESGGHDDPAHLYWPRLSLQVREDRPYHGKAAMCRTRDFKYVRRLYESDELYDLSADPQELHNRIDDPALQDTRRALEDRMLTWYMETCDVVPRATDAR